MNTRKQGTGRRVVAVLVMLAALLAGGIRDGVAGEPAAVHLLGIEAVREGQGVRVRLELSEPAPLHFFTLDAPRRLVIDYASRSGEGPRARPFLPPPLSAVRHGLFRPDRARIVFEMDRPMAVARQTGEAGGRVVDLRLEPVSAESFAARAGWPEGARWDGAGIPLPPARPGDGRLLVAIDPGHGGIDPGAMVEGLVEKDIVLAFARRLARALEGTGEIRAMLTRDRDVFLPLGARVRMAQRAGAHLFVSIHADIVTEGDAAGLSVYTLAPEATDATAAALAERENRSDLLAGAGAEGIGDDVARVLIELAQRGSMAEADRLAEATLAALRPEVELLRTRPHREADFRVLKAPEIPSMLIELGFLTNAEDRARIVTPEWQVRAAGGIARGILDWARGADAAWRAPRG